MALFREIASSTDLPNLGTGRETGTFDFKGSADPTNQRELAKDIAGFANSLGGVILVGAVEDPATGTLQRYNPMATVSAERLRQAYEQANSQRCQPTPFIDVVRIGLPSPSGGDVVAVNVYPTPMGPVGVRWDDDRAGPSFAFPLRTATQTHFLNPTELAMLMVPEIRRVAILLDSIPSDQRNKIIFHFLARESQIRAWPTPATLLEVDPKQTAATFSLDGAVGSVPLDRVGSVWRRDGENWNIVIEGWFEVRGQTLLFFPRNL